MLLEGGTEKKKEGRGVRLEMFVSVCRSVCLCLWVNHWKGAGVRGGRVGRGGGEGNAWGRDREGERSRGEGV